VWTKHLTGGALAVALLNVGFDVELWGGAGGEEVSGERRAANRAQPHFVRLAREQLSALSEPAIKRNYLTNSTLRTSVSSIARCLNRAIQVPASASFVRTVRCPLCSHMCMAIGGSDV